MTNVSRLSRRLARSPAARTIGSAIAAAALVVAAKDHDPFLVWNASASMPRGLYAVLPGATATGEVAIVRMPLPFASLAISRGYLRPGVLLVKEVAAGRGDRVCAFGRRVIINGRQAVMRRPIDGMGRALPQWAGCRVLVPGEILLLGRADPASFDGRYFGPISTDCIVGRAVLLWQI